MNDNIPNIPVRFTPEASKSIASNILPVLQSQNSIYNVKDYGAVGDGIADDTASIQAAIDASLLRGGIVYAPAGEYRFSKTLVFNNHRSVRFIGVALPSLHSEEQKGTIFKYAGTADDQLYLHDCFSVSVENIQFESYHPLTGGYVIHLYGEHETSAYCSVSNCHIRNCFNGIHIDGVSGSILSNIFISVGNGGGDTAIRCSGTVKRLDQVRLQNVGVDAEGSNTMKGFYFDRDTHTLFVDQCYALRCEAAFWLTGGTECVRISNSEADNSKISGIVIQDAYFPWFTNVSCATNGDNGIVFTREFHNSAIVDGVDARGNKNSGILIDGSGRGGVRITNPRIGGNARGVSVGANVSNFSIQGGKIGGNMLLEGVGQSDGIFINYGTSNRYMITGIDLSGNTTPINNSSTGPNKIITNNILV